MSRSCLKWIQKSNDTVKSATIDIKYLYLSCIHPQLLATQHCETLTDCLYFPAASVRSALLYPLRICRLRMHSPYIKRFSWHGYQLVFTHRGSGAIRQGKIDYHMTSGSLFLLDCRQPHYFYCCENQAWEYTFVHFDGPSAAHLFAKIAQIGLLCRNADVTFMATFEALMSLTQRQKDSFDIIAHQELTAMLSLLASRLQNSSDTGTPEWLKATLRFMSSSYNQHWSIHDLALLSHLSDSRFAHLFTQLIGCSPMEYRNHLRIEQAKKYLMDTKWSIDVIAEQVGFSTLSAFYTVFKRKTGITPAQYRSG